MTARAALLDVDGTLIDTNYQHALAWYRAFRRHGIVLPIWRIHRSIGMGGDQLVPALVGEETDRERGDEIRETRDEIYKDLIGEVEPLHGSRELIVDLKERGVQVVLASSSPQDELDHYLELLDARELADAWTTKDDVEQTKPAPDLVRAAMDKAETDDAVMIGDTRWDIEAAAKAGVETVAVMTGGWSRDELLDAGAVGRLRVGRRPPAAARLDTVRLSDDVGGMVTADDVRAFARTLPRSSEAFVRGRVKFRIGRIVYLSLSKDGSTLGFAFPKEWREALVESEPEKFSLPSDFDMRYHWAHVRLAAIDADEMRELVEDAWAFCVPKRVVDEYAATRR